MSYLSCSLSVSALCLIFLGQSKLEFLISLRTRVLAVYPKIYFFKSVLWFTIFLGV